LFVEERGKRGKSEKERGTTNRKTQSLKEGEDEGWG